MDSTIDTIAKGRTIAILRGDYYRNADRIATALAEAGVTGVEVTFNSPNVLESIAMLAAKFSGRMAVGAGTVLSPHEVRQARTAGAQFIVSPNMDPAVIHETKEQGMVSFPGCFTPTEAVAAVKAGADAVKLFPASSLGIGFVKAIRGPMPDLRLVPTGGVTPEMAAEYFAAGAWAVGVGSELVSKDVFEPGGLDRLRDRALAFANAARN
jgi:Entner-Doudoroff aldolase